MWHRFFSGRGFYLGTMFEEAAARHGAVAVTLDRPLDVAPDSGREHTYRTVAGLEQMTQHNAALVEESAAVSARLKAQSDELARIVGSFKLA